MRQKPAVVAAPPSAGPATAARARRHLWFAGYVALVALPLPLAWLTDPLPQPRPVRADVGVALGFLALSLLLIQFALVSRLRPVSRPFGADVLMQWHRGAAILALAFVVAHPVLVPGLPWSAWNPFSGPRATQTGAVALWATVVITVTSSRRKALGLSYEAWQVIHLGSACVIVVAALWHVMAVGVYTSAPALGWLLTMYAALFAALVVRYRLIRPLELARQPWRIAVNEDVGGNTRRVAVRPDGHAGFAFEPGQFAWLLTGRSPLLSAQHPLSIASSAVRGADGTIEFAIKALGDWSAMRVPELEPGRVVWVDGPYGSFTPDPASAEPLVLIAGGIGIAPIRSMLHTLSAREDRRRIYLFYAASDWSRVVFVDEIDRLTRTLDLHVTFVFEQPGTGWTGERGFVTTELLARHLPAGMAEFEYFVCGPLPMIDALESALTALRVPTRHIHTERFQMV